MRYAVAIGAALMLLFPSAAQTAGLDWQIVSGTPGENGWYRSNVVVKITATPPGGTCPVQVTFTSVDNHLTCSANGVTLDLQFKIDVTAPTVSGASPERPPDKAGWYAKPVTVTFAGSDAGSGIASCTSMAFSGPDSEAASVSGACKDNAGNVSGASSYALKYDGTAPSVTAAPTRATDGNGWFRQAVTIGFSGSDGTSGVESCSGGVPYSGPDTAGTSISGTCTDRAGNVSAPASFEVRYDATAPSVAASADRAAGANGWYSRPVTVAFAGTDGGSGIESCAGGRTYSGPDDGTATVSGTCTDHAGNSASGALTLKYDETRPEVEAKPERAPAAGGWYTRPITFAFSAKDGASGVASCSSPATYSGPDDATAQVTGSCRDNAGNVANASVPVRYDDTAPKLTGVTVQVAGASATVVWREPSDTVAVAVTRTPGRGGTGRSMVYAGPANRFRDNGLRAGVMYRYTLRSRDAAGNEATTAVTASLRRLFAPAPGAVAKAGERLTWKAVAGATYYNVQLFRNGKKILSAWPVGTSFRLPASWTYGGKRMNLTRALYRWYLWPGKGSRAAAEYGPLLGSSTFRVR